MIVVSNTSPITNLAAIGQLEMLQQLYAQVLIPQAVYGELTFGGVIQPGGREAQTLSRRDGRAFVLVQFLG